MKKTVCVDLDGVLADYSMGFQGIDNIGDPIPGAVEFTKRLSEFATVVVFTTRCKEYQPGTMGRDTRGKDQLVAVVETWLKKHGFHFDHVYSGQGKPMAACYIDDRAVVCRPQSKYLVPSGGDGPTVSDVFAESLAAAHNFCKGEV